MPAGSCLAQVCVKVMLSCPCWDRWLPFLLVALNGFQEQAALDTLLWLSDLSPLLPLQSVF